MRPSSVFSLPADRRERRMGTWIRQRIYGIAGAECIDRVSDAFARWERSWSVFREESVIRQLGRAAGSLPIAIDQETAAVLRQAKQLTQLTGGAFDVTTGPAVSLWREAARRQRPPSADEIEAARILVGAEAIELSDGPACRLSRPGQQIDLGAIGKGFAADSCIDLYRRAGVRHAVLDLGGHIALLGSRPDGARWKVGIRAPSGGRQDCIGYLEAEDVSVVTSGHYERSFEIDGRRYSHIVDPRSGVPVDNELASVTIVHPSSILADALATAGVVLGVERGLALARTFGAEALFLDRTGEFHGTAELVDRFERA